MSRAHVNSWHALSWFVVRGSWLEGRRPSTGLFEQRTTSDEPRQETGFLVRFPNANLRIPVWGLWIRIRGVRDRRTRGGVSVLSGTELGQASLGAWDGWRRRGYEQPFGTGLPGRKLRRRRRRLSLPYQL